MDSRRSLAAGAGLALLLGGGAAASDGGAEALDGATLYAQRTCIACHGPDAKTPILPEYPKLAGQNPAYMLRQMKDIKSGARSNGSTAAMRGIMHLVTEPEMEVLAQYLSGLQP
jgi:cytochrome c